MKKNLLLLTAFIAAIIAINACKADKPILPGDKGYVAAIPPGGDTTGTGGGGGGGGGGSINVDTSLFSGTWKVGTTYSGDIQDGTYNRGQITSLAVVPDVTINSNIKVGYLALLLLFLIRKSTR